MKTRKIVRFVQDFIFKSLELDYRFISRNPFMTFLEKLKFLYIKYKIIIHYIIFRRFNFGISKVKLFGNDFYYNHGLAGIGGLQASLIQHINLFKKVELNTSPILIDVGANVGNVSYWFLKTFHNSSVFAIEPGQVCFGVLEKNLSVFDKSRVKLFNSLCSSESNKLLNFNTNDEESSLSKIIDVQGKVTHEANNLVKSTTLDSLLENENLPHIDILKIDTEGHELEVLLGSKSVLRKVGYLHIELNQAEYAIGDLFNLLQYNGMKIELIDIRVFHKSQGHIKSADLFLKLTKIN